RVIKDPLSAKHQRATKDQLSAKHQRATSEVFKVKDIVKEVEYYLKAYSSAEMDIRWMLVEWLRNVFRKSMGIRPLGKCHLIHSPTKSNTIKGEGMKE
ncbi:hypothetical protein Tco_0263074, partial [Tanacetum coccineum]